MLAKFGRVLPFIALVLAVVATSAQAPGPAQPKCAPLYPEVPMGDAWEAPPHA